MLATGWYADMVALKVYKEVGVMGLWLNTGGVVVKKTVIAARIAETASHIKSS